MSSSAIPWTELAAEAIRRCESLAVFSEEADRLTRVFLSAPMRGVHDQVSGWMRDAGMVVRMDAIGNLIGRYAADREDRPALLLGSHLDTVPDAGKFDGILGVMLGIGVVKSLRSRRLPFALEVIGFSEEEGVRFQAPYLGSRAAAGRFDPALLSRRDRDGHTMAEVIRFFGGDPTRLESARYAPERILGYLEAHIEQGAVLEQAGAALGVVTAIAGQSRLSLRLAGRAAHAGTTPMDMRRDALAGAAALISETERIASGSPGVVATVGSLHVTPNAPNVVPGVAELTLDVRHSIDAKREAAVAELVRSGREIAEARRLEWTVLHAVHQHAVPLDPRMQQLLADAATAAGQVAPAIVSGAGHDAAIMAEITPAAMLFLRSPGGISHHPEESVLQGDVETALQVLAGFLDRFHDMHRLGQDEVR